MSTKLNFVRIFSSSSPRLLELRAPFIYVRQVLLLLSEHVSSPPFEYYLRQRAANMVRGNAVNSEKIHIKEYFRRQ